MTHATYWTLRYTLALAAFAAVLVVLSAFLAVNLLTLGLLERRLARPASAVVCWLSAAYEPWEWDVRPRS